MRSLMCMLCLLTTQVLAVDHAVLYMALKGDNDAKFLIAEQLSDRQSDFYSPNKAQDMFLSLAKQGDRRTFSPLATLFSDPFVDNYAPRRSLFYLSKIEPVSPTRLALYEFLAGKIDTEALENIAITQTDKLYGIISILRLYPFYELSPQQLSDVKQHFSHPSVARYEPYIYPSLLTPVIGETHLYGVDSLMDNQSWDFDELTGKYFPLRDSKGVISVQLPKKEGIRELSVDYAPENFAQIKAYYSEFLPYTLIRNGSVFDAPGLKITVKRSATLATVTFLYKNLPALIQY